MRAQPGKVVCDCPPDKGTNVLRAAIVAAVGLAKACRASHRVITVSVNEKRQKERKGERERKKPRAGNVQRCASTSLSGKC